MPEVALPLWVVSPHGTRWWLSDDWTDDHIAASLAREGGRLFPRLLDVEPEGGVVLEIGGHHGLWAAEALVRYPSRRLVVVEPHPGWCRRIRRHVEANHGTSRTRIVAACLADDRQPRTLRFDRRGGTWGATVFDAASAGESVPVASATLADVLAGDDCVMIHCNAEGAEFPLVRQLAADGIRPPLVTLMAHSEYGDVTELRATMRRLGYAEQPLRRDDRRPVIRYVRRPRVPASVTEAT